MNPRPLENKPRERCRKWELRALGGINPKTGKRAEHTRRFEGTYTQAVKATQALVAEMPYIDVSRRFTGTFNDVCELWLAQRLNMRLIAPSTARKQHYQLKTIERHIGKMPLAKIKTIHINNAIAAMMNGDSSSGKCLTGTYATQVLTTTRALFDWCIDQGFITTNPARRALTPKIDTKERPALTDEQISALMDATPPTSAYNVAVRLALMAGLRRGECLSLKWSDVNTENYTLHIRGTKTKASDAVVPLVPALYNYLISWHVQQFAEETLDGRHRVYVLDGMHPEALQTWWRRHRVSFGLQDYHFHDLRHSFATKLAKAGTHPKAIQALMRHKDERMAMRIYTHFMPEDLSGILTNIF